MARISLRLVALSIRLPCSGGALQVKDWPQFKFECPAFGNVPDRNLQTPWGWSAAAALTDAVFTAPVVADGRVYVVDGSGVAFCLDAATLRVIWKVATRGGARNCNNVSSPAVAGRYLHFGTMAGVYYVLDAASGKVVKEIACGEPIFSAPVVGKDRVYFATLGSQVYALGTGRPGVLEVGLRQGTTGLHGRPLERPGMGPAPEGPGPVDRAVFVLAGHRPRRPHCRAAGRRYARLAGRPSARRRKSPGCTCSTRPRWG